jgi:hypothetical protein
MYAMYLRVYLTRDRLADALPSVLHDVLTERLIQRLGDVLRGVQALPLMPRLST